MPQENPTVGSSRFTVVPVKSWLSKYAPCSPRSERVAVIVAAVAGVVHVRVAAVEPSDQRSKPYGRPAASVCAGAASCSAKPAQEVTVVGPVTGRPLTDDRPAGGRRRRA